MLNTVVIVVTVCVSFAYCSQYVNEAEVNGEQLVRQQSHRHHDKFKICRLELVSAHLN